MELCLAAKRAEGGSPTHAVEALLLCRSPQALSELTQRILGVQWSTMEWLKGETYHSLGHRLSTQGLSLTNKIVILNRNPRDLDRSGETMPQLEILCYQRKLAVPGTGIVLLRSLARGVPAKPPNIKDDCQAVDYALQPDGETWASLKSDFSYEVIPFFLLGFHFIFQN